MKPAKGPGGRPTDYDPAYCEQLQEAAKLGLSLTGFAGLIGVSRATINNWMAAHPEFLEAVSCAKAVMALSWERRAINIGDGNGGAGAAPIVQFALKNLAPGDWTDKQSFEHAGPDGKAMELKVSADDGFAALASVLDGVGRAKAGGADEAGGVAEGGKTGTDPGA